MAPDEISKGEFMYQNPFVGNWIYRSFHNITTDPQQLTDLLLWQATLILTEDGPNLVKGRLSSGNYALDIRGAVSIESDEKSIFMRATGIEGSPTAGWIYDYSGFLAPNWPEGDHQRPAIVGTVTRTVPHAPNRSAGSSYSFVAVSQDFPAAPYELPKEVVAHFADKVHRLHHAVWHGIRQSWNGLTEDEQKQITDLDWQIEGNRFALYSPGEKTRPVIENGAGEDFLYFHRQMVAHYRMMMSDLGVKPIEWIEIPQPGTGGAASPDAVPAGWKIPEAPNFERRLKTLKSDEFFWSRMRWWDFQFKDPNYLSTLTLGEFGALLEYSVHNDMHIRWSAIPRDPDTNSILSLGRPSYDISDRWDNPRYDWLGEFYSSHVNPVFWRLHGWIDDRIEDWAHANEQKHPGSITRTELGGVSWFKPGKLVKVDYPWVWPRSLGGYGNAHAEDPPELREKKIESMKKVMAILYPPPAKDRFLRTSTDFAATDTVRSSVVGF
jgi:hypothetical protein